MKTFRRLAIVLAAFVCCALVGCSALTEDNSITSLAEDQVEELKTIAEDYVGVLGVMADDSYEDLIEQQENAGNMILANGVKALKDSREDTGIYKRVISSTAAENDDGTFRITVNSEFEKRNVEIIMGLDKTLSTFTEFSVTPEYTMGEKMKKAALNLVVGMVTVFAVLILLALIISCFKYIGKLEAKFTGKKESPKKAEAGVAEKTLNAGAAKAKSAAGEISPELIAVITAAIAASAGTSAEGLVVRSIRRVARSRR